MKRFSICCVAILGLMFLARPAAAHFPWVTISDVGKVIYFFGENPADRTYKLPESIAKAKVGVVNARGKVKNVELKSVESDALVGLTSADSVRPRVTLASQITYGIFRGSRLDYYTMHQGGKLPKTLDANESKTSPLDLHARLVDTDSGVDVYVIWKGKPLANVEVHLYCDEGHEEGNAKTDEGGRVSFSDKQVEDGLNGIMVGHTAKGEAGEFHGQTYESASHYLTVTFNDPQTSAKK